MLWYGYIYYTFFFVLLFVSLITTFRLSFISVLEKYLLVYRIASASLSILLTLAFLSLTTLYYLFDNFSTFSLLWTSIPGEAIILSYESPSFLVNQYFVNLHPVSIYCFPFVYIFVVVTAISLLFCLSYNVNELTTFTFYCVVILLAGYTMFFTSSLILFFLSYETLLIPSFFILYNFAKTRRCVEAAYLMFFWTQFGALFLIFGFLYLFLVSGSTSFESVSTVYFSSFELNFLFFCLPWIMYIKSWTKRDTFKPWGNILSTKSESISFCERKRPSKT